MRRGEVLNSCGSAMCQCYRILMARRYSDEEASAILRRAIAINAERDDREPAAGASLEDLKKTASELGIDSESLLAAAAEVESAGAKPSLVEWLVGGYPKLEEVCFAKGLVSKENWPAVLNCLRAETGRTGDQGEVGGMFEWSAGDPDHTFVSFEPEGDGTWVRVAGFLGEWASVSTVLGAIAGFFTGLVNLGQTAWPIALPATLALMALGGLTGRWILRSHRRGRVEQAKKLLDAVQEVIEHGDEGLRDRIAAEPTALSSAEQTTETATEDKT